MRIYSYVLRLNPEVRNVFTESVVEDVEECNGGWSKRGSSVWAITRYSDKMVFESDSYQPMIKVASTEPIVDAKKRMCEFAEKYYTDRLMEYIEDVQKKVGWLREVAGQ